MITVITMMITMIIVKITMIIVKITMITVMITMKLEPYITLPGRYKSDSAGLNCISYQL